MHSALPLSSKNGPLLNGAGSWSEFDCLILIDIRRRSRQQPSRRLVEVAKRVGLEAIGENTKKQMTGEVSGRFTSKHYAPASPKRLGIEIAQTRDLDTQCLLAGLRPSNFNARHGLKGLISA